MKDEMLKFVNKAEFLIKGGYPVPTDDVYKLAKIMFNQNRKNLTFGGSPQQSDTEDSKEHEDR